MNRLACRVMVAVAGMAVLGMTATLAGAQTHPATYTLNDVMQAPFASDMLAGPTGTAVAWVFNAKGCSNIWVADPHGAKARQITPYTEDDGFDVGELAWSPDTKSIAFTRAQSLEDETPANASSSPEGARLREVWVVATAGGAPHKVGPGDSPSFSPDGSRLLFVDKKRILTVAASGDGDPRRLGRARDDRNAGRRTNPSCGLYTQRCDAGAVCVGHAGRALGRSRGVGIQREGLQ